MTNMMNNLSDKLLSKVLGNLTDLTDFRNTRLVSQKWKQNVMEACRNKFHVLFPLTDSTLYDVNSFKNAPVSFDIFAFTGKEPKDVWQKSGIEPLMRTTEWLQFTGSEVDISEIRKFLDLAHNSLKTLSLRSFRRNLACPFLEMKENFSALRKVSLGYYFTGTAAGHVLFSTFTKTLEKWIRLDCRVQLPLLESLNLCFDSYFIGKCWKSKEATMGILFRNYLAIAKLMLKYKQTLREVQIERHIQMGLYRYVGVGFVQPEWVEMERGLEALDDLNLNRIRVSKSQKLQMDDNSLETGIEMSGRPKDLKNFLFNNLMLPFSNWGLLLATLSNLRNVDVSHLTTIKISLLLGRFPDPTMAVNFDRLKDCKNLRTLCFNLSINEIEGATQLVVRNVELLPKGISTLHFENIDEDDNRHMMGMEILLSQQQMRWIIDNLRGLESFRTSLAIPERGNNAIVNNVQGNVAGAAGANNNQGGDNAQQQEQRMNRLVNINLDTFRDLLAMPKLKDLKLDMMKAIALRIAANLDPWIGGVGTTLDDVREYSNLCKAAGFTATTTTVHQPDRNFGANNILGYAKLTIKKNQQ